MNLYLVDDRVLYEAKRSASSSLAEQFYDQSRSWGAALKSCLQKNDFTANTELHDRMPVRTVDTAGRI
jgi:hypothetical protein